MTRRRSPASDASPLPSPSRGSSWRRSRVYPFLEWFLLVLCLSIVFGTSVLDARSSCVDDSVRDVCAGSASFCFPSTLAGFGSRELDSCQEPGFGAWAGGASSKWRPGDVAVFRMANGGVVSCSFVDVVSRVDGGVSSGGKSSGLNDVSLCMPPLVPDVWMRMSSGMTADLDDHAEDVDLGLLNGSSPPNVEISPHFLGWGENSLYTPSIAFLAVTNTHKIDVLHVYEPFSTNPQYYAYAFQKLALAPGESASIAFIFLPRWLGSSSAHLVLQTSFGGFIIPARGVAVESPYKIEPLIGINLPSNKQLSRNFSLYNPLDEVLHVEEVSAWFFLSGQTNQSMHVVCRMDALQPSSTEFNNLLSDNEWFRVESIKLGARWLDIRPHRRWEVSAQKTQPILDMRLWPYVEGKILGAICLKMRSAAEVSTGTIVLPLEIEVHGKTDYSDSSSSVSVDIEALEHCNRRETVLTISLRNDGADLLRLVNVSEVTEGSKLFKVRYKEGLLLFPGTVTKLALVSYSSQDIAPEIPTESMDCILLISTNSSDSSAIKIPCIDLLHSGSNGENNSGIITSDGSYISWVSQSEEKYTNARTGSLQSIVDGSFSMKPKLLEAFEADEVILSNWISQGAVTESSVLEERELLFPVIPIRTHFSKWISVRNPSQQPVVMQLVLNSAEVVGQCKSADVLHAQTFSSKFTEIDSPETKIGFSLSDAAMTEALVHPSESALFGPVVFHPSNRCMWRSSALIRNNLSGVEWFPIQAFGGSHLLILIEGSEPVWKLEFNLHLPINMSSSDFLSHIQNTSTLCNYRFSKEIYAKNIGEVPLEVKKLKVSGTDCGLDGFMIHRCKGFILEPGESMSLLISYKADFSTYVVHRDLELVLATGIFVIPMKASLPVYMLNHCKKSYFQAVHWKTSLLIFAAASTLVLLIRIVRHFFLLGTEEYYDKVDNTISKAGKSSCCHHSAKVSRSSREDERPKAEFLNEYHICENVMIDNHKKMQGKQDFGHQKEVPVSPPTLTNMLEAPQNSLSIRIVREKGRRRKRRTTGIGVAAKLEVSSSQSGNSTPSSPLSPNASTPKQGWPLSPESGDMPFTGLPSGQKHQGKHDAEDSVETIVSKAEKHCEKAWIMPSQKQSPLTLKSTGKPTMSPLVNIPGSGWSSPCAAAPSVLAAHSPIAPHARAPGPKSSKDKAINVEENDEVGKEFTYDIWGNHFSGISRVRREELTNMVDASEGDSQSFFSRDPQSLMTMSYTWSVSSGQLMM